MSTSLNILGKVVFLSLLSYFLWRVVFSGQKLMEDKIGSTRSTQYSKWRLFPSFSICFKMKNVTPDSLLRDMDGTLQRVLDEVLVYFQHNNISESGWDGVIIQQYSIQLNIAPYRVQSTIDRTAVFAHVGNPQWAELCIAYEPTGPTIKTSKGVKNFKILMYLLMIAMFIREMYSITGTVSWTQHIRHGIWRIFKC